MLQLLSPVTMDLQEELLEEIEIEDVFSFSIGSLEINVDEATVVMWIIMAFLVIVSFILTRGLKVTGKISKRQMVLELLYEKGEALVKSMIGENGGPYVQWLLSILIFIGASNIAGMFGFKPPTKSIQVTAALAITSVVLIEVAAYRKKGVGGRLKALAQPTAIVLPINILEIFTRPLSLALRLFGNVLGAFIIMKLIEAVVPVILPTVFSLYFDIFDGFLQAYIFVFLTSIYVKEAME